jgi:hypothetical protein
MTHPNQSPSNTGEALSEASLRLQVLHQATTLLDAVTTAPSTPFGAIRVMVSPDRHSVSFFYSNSTNSQLLLIQRLGDESVQIVTRFTSPDTQSTEERLVSNTHYIEPDAVLADATSRLTTTRHETNLSDEEEVPPYSLGVIGNLLRDIESDRGKPVPVPMRRSIIKRWFRRKQTELR